MQLSAGYERREREIIDLLTATFTARGASGTGAPGRGAVRLARRLVARAFIALCRKAGVRPRRCPRQRRTTVVVRVPRSVFERTVIAEFDALHGELTAAFVDLVDHPIADVMHGDADEAGLDQPRIAKR